MSERLLPPAPWQAAHVMALAKPGVVERARGAGGAPASAASASTATRATSEA